MNPLTCRLSRRTAACVLLACLTGAATHAVAQSAAGTYPNKSIAWVVGWPPGGSADTATRLIAHRLEQMLGQPVVVENRQGAAGVIALNYAAKAPADGYTLVTVPGPVLTATPAPLIGRELAAVAMMGKGPAVLFGTKAEPLPDTVPELITALKAKPQHFNYVSSGNGTAQHLAGELFNQMAGTRINHIPYKGGTQAVTDVIGGQVNLGVLGITSVLPHIQAGKLKPYAVTTATRSKNLPDVPALAETLPGFEATQWFVVASPAGTPTDRIDKLNAAIGAILKEPEIAAGFARVGIDPEAATPAQTAEFVTQDLQRWKQLVDTAHLNID
ncbi:Bug family tripartite tricarboxylate transporter substrate binding protein [Bordetella genomosp. 12]|uniref:ABC transporter substrate-binding protein n=1 Tax=Bordetella genomosp. 12 TaxID=463035 RepID=A0A261VCD6_9BORD|nr:tripartite tricarboxylate transporter substrate-binding protein [Bordetella genomosp. 12]OZI71808.1 ABC transporter substrate-binding protein [Bordetella genomosp. 12]